MLLYLQNLQIYIYRRRIQKSGDKTLHYIRASVRQGCRTVTFSGALNAFATAVAVRPSASGRTLRFIRMAIVHTAGHQTLYGGIKKCPHRLQGRAHNSEAVL